MANKCFCHLNGYEVKDSTAREGLEAVNVLVNAHTNAIKEIQGDVESLQNSAGSGGSGTDHSAEIATLQESVTDNASAIAGLQEDVEALQNSAGSGSGSGTSYKIKYVGMGYETIDFSDIPDNSYFKLRIRSIDYALTTTSNVVSNLFKLTLDNSTIVVIKAFDFDVIMHKHASSGDVCVKTITTYKTTSFSDSTYTITNETMSNGIRTVYGALTITRYGTLDSNLTAPSAFQVLIEITPIEV